MTKRPSSVSATLVFIILNALIWLVLGGLIAIHAHPTLPDDPTLQAGMAVLSFAAGGILLGIFFLLRKRRRGAWFMALGFFAVASILTFFDDFGLADLVVLVINIVPIILLVKDRDWYLGGRSEASQPLPTPTATLKAAFPTGRFVNGDFSWEFKAGGTFISYGPPGSETGTYLVSGDQVAITCQCCGEITGTYIWSYENDRLAFKTIQDECSNRQAVVGRSMDSSILVLKRSVRCHPIWRVTGIG